MLKQNSFRLRELASIAGSLVLPITTLFIAGIVIGCCPSKQARQYDKDIQRIRGTMDFVDIEGGCWTFVAEDGTSYEVTGEGAERLRKKGLKAEIAVKPDHSGLMSICMTGKIVSLVDIITVEEENE